MPKISVLLPIYNTNEKHLRATIEGILNQTYKDFELLILNDSPENTFLDEIISSFNDKRIRYLKNKHNMDITASRNKLIDLAKGEYLAIHDHDDVSLPQRFEKEVAVLDDNPEIGVVSCNFRKMVAKKDVKLPQNDADIRIFLMNKCVIVHSAAMIRKSVLTKNDIQYEAQFSPAEDYRLWCRLVAHTQFYNIQEVLFLYNDHADNTTNHARQKMENAALRIRNDNACFYPNLYKTALDKLTIITSGRLFGFLPLIKTIKKGQRTKVYLFSFIPLWQNRVTTKY